MVHAKKKISKKKRIRKPSHPGEILKNLWLDELEYTQSYFADLLVEASKGLVSGAVKKSIMLKNLNEVITGKKAMSARFAVLVSKVLKTDPKMWMNLQVHFDLWVVEQEVN